MEIDLMDMNKKDEVMMQLVHYFITVKNYNPIVVHGASGEVWLENINESYRIIRISSNYIHNNEQLDFDLFKIKNVVKQVKKKTLSFKVNTLNILLNIGSNVRLHDTNNIDCIVVNYEKGVRRAKKLNALYPDLKNNLVEPDGDNINFLIHVTDDINKKADKDNKEFERVFSPKKITVTYALMAINILVFIAGFIGRMTGGFDLYTALALHRDYVQTGEVYRLISAAFTHESIFHLAMNMYALYIIGTQVETFIGKSRYLAIYIYSAIIGCLLSCVVNSGWSLGASGAIFGLMGTLLYFGYHYRLYLDSTLRTQILPLILFNLALGFIIPNIDSAGHIGGLIGGVFMSMAVGIQNKSSKSDRINGIICSTLLIAFLAFMLFMY